MAEVMTFNDLVREAFIKPLRSVLIVDDQYPTWEEIFNSRITGDKHSSGIEAKSSRKTWVNSAVAGEVYGLINEFRTQKPGFIIDIHDGVSENPTSESAGNETPRELANHLHQSDLLILDYNLEGAEAGLGGDMARQILASVLDNRHFNLVVIHTSEDLETTMHQCLISLMNSISSSFSEECTVALDKLDDLISEKEDFGDFDRGEILEKIDMASYLELRRSEQDFKSALGKFMQSAAPFIELSEWAKALELDQKAKKCFFYWAIRAFEKKYQNDFTKKPPVGLVWKISEESRWLRAARGFVCFVKKGPENLLAVLENAIVDWKPTPSRLLSAKYRDEVSQMGVEIEDQSLKQTHAFAKFYDLILNSGGSDLPVEQVNIIRRHKLKNHVSRQSEMLSFMVEESIANFGQKIYDVDKSAGFVFKTHYGVDLDNENDKRTAISQYNRYICCLPSRTEDSNSASFDQLDSGHVFKLDETWWVCATPACDLQPGQSTIAFKSGNDASLRPFTAIRLHAVTNLAELTDRHINSGSYCYVEFGGKILGLGLKSPKEDSNNPAIQKVEWRAFIAQRGGVIESGRLNLLELQLELDGLKIKSDTKEVQVVAKLRYEYALNYIQRIGTSVSRIGLGYVAT
ncbi:response regulator receiver domain [Pseudomonas parakoreensis]|uniref:response regulator receiver domain n=1 Tax=Pseudomonas parakoreensis TaxID=2892331 RepID=UPI00103DA0C8|nr:response regulator receiver domain [Pseudomonas parakoreensis]